MIVTDLYKNILLIVDYKLLNKCNSWLTQWIWSMQMETSSSKYFRSVLDFWFLQDSNEL